VADVFDALTHPRPYKAAWTAQAALDEILDQAGRQFDPEVARAFAALHRDGRVVEVMA
jgi:putative two-component system response regulator/two-component system response regulator RpfG